MFTDFAEHDIDLADDQLITLGRACRPLPKRPSPTTLWRWRTTGVLIKGRRIRLQAVKIGESWYTTVSAFERFIREQTEAALAPPVPPSQDRPADTENRLSRAGLI
jgi:hypothetical protein